jgi:hypothetical protein
LIRAASLRLYIVASHLLAATPCVAKRNPDFNREGKRKAVLLHSAFSGTVHQQTIG